ncbi:uncharacterized protein LOC126631366 [Malus sylvestris]|uniref:uncharacterized protein LOC126631366 n=1 Tax=Malus sylvestris TaxID=3752 RepID=UPI0021AC358D|nr:uncharacterized protein LOC126631366 [Malus sylvestris]
MVLRKSSLRSAGSFKTGLSLLSTNSKKVVTEISKFASGLLQLHNEPVEEGEAVDDGGGHVPGIMDEVLIGFFIEILVMPNRSTDFPTTLDHATSVHQPFIKMTSPISLVKSNQVVLKLQSFHEEKILAREKADQFFSQFRQRYKRKSRPCL